MTKDYSRRASPQDKPVKLQSPSWVPFFYGFFIGVLLTAAAWMMLTPAGTQLQMPGFVSKAKRPANGVVVKEEDEPQRPRFDFYTILPEMEVVVSEEETAPPVANYTKPETTGTLPVSKDSYRLQVGSFKKVSDADRQKARLALLGVEAEIQRVTIASGDTYYRVLTAAMSNRSELNKKQRILQQNAINSLVVKSRN